MNTFLKPTPEFRKLQILLQISADPDGSQAKISRQIGISVSMVNSYLKKLQAEKLILYAGENHKQMQYYVTEAGEDVKSILIHQFMNETVGIYKRAKAEFLNKLKQIMKDGIRTVAFYGAAETCEVVIASAIEAGLTIKTIVDEDENKHGRHIVGYQVNSPDILESASIDAVCITSSGYWREILENIRHLESRGIKIYRI